jgi:hypothetical protein
MIANIASDDALILPQRANPTGLNFRERQLVHSLNHPGGNLTDVTTPYDEAALKRLGLLG